MIAREWSGRVRLVLGFLVAPVVAPACCIVLLAVIVIGRQVDCPALLPIIMVAIAHVGGVAAYVFAALMGLPYVLLLRKRGELDFWALMAPVLGLILPLFLLLFIIGAMVDTGVGIMMLVPLPGIVLSVVCFYFLAVWKSG